MGVRNKKEETLGRLNSKTLDARFSNEIQTGLYCSPFESEAVLDVVKEVDLIRQFLIRPRPCCPIILNTAF
jgi:hypothetical protein